jgi:transglutaminase-like putative cysteine protease
MFVGIIAAGTLFSFLVQWLIGDQPVTKYDGLMYLAVGIATFAFREDLAKMVPDQPFAEQLLHTGTLCWLLALGSFFTWRDGTLLFQAVPSIALFGMVGAFDTFKAAPALFFAFLVCLATLFARAHRRQMIEQAEASGYKAMLAREEEASGNASEKGGARLQAILAGPWKWMAGPEWALASALAIVLISLLGAPALRVVLKPIAGSIKVPPPPLTLTQAASLLGGSDTSRVTIGRGPQRLGERVVITAEMDEKRYLRARTYGVYSASGWEIANQNRTSAPVGALNAVPAGGIDERSASEIARKTPITFKITLIDPGVGSVPVPGEVPNQGLVEEGGRRNLAARRSDGTYQLQLGIGDVLPPFVGRAVVPAPNQTPKEAVQADNLPGSMQDYADKSVVPEDVAAFAREVTKGAKTDYEKAMAIKQAIERTCLYNLKAPATPANVDPVSYFLFTSHQGYCDLFASASALCARAVGIPSRYVTGFYPILGKRTDDGKAWAMSESEAHAWGELFFKDIGWVVFDATEGAAEVPGGSRGQATGSDAWYRQNWFKTALDGSIAAVVLAGLLFAGLFFRKSVRSRVPSREDVGREYARFAFLLQKLSGRRRLPSQTPDEYLSAAERGLGSSAPLARDLNSRFVNALYSPLSIDSGLLKELRNATEQLRTQARSKGEAQ